MIVQHFNSVFQCWKFMTSLIPIHCWLENKIIHRICCCTTLPNIN